MPISRRLSCIAVAQTIKIRPTQWGPSGHTKAGQSALPLKILPRGQSVHYKALSSVVRYCCYAATKHNTPFSTMPQQPNTIAR